MAKLPLRRPENIPGDFYVDQSCIDCDTCRWLAPEIFERNGQQSAVYQQPHNSAQRNAALQALLACPTASIGTVTKPKEIKIIQEQFPLLIADQVYYCGYHSESSYGAASYLIVRPEGNVLVDSPRFAAPLVKRLEAMGGVQYMYLTHCDDVADHQKFRDYFQCDRILHQDDITSETEGIEIPLRGTNPHVLADDLLIIPVPGHTKGHTVLLYRNQFLFTGDHLAWSARLGHLYAFRNFCWYSWRELVQSMHNLTQYDFTWILPGHGRRFHSDLETMRREMAKCLNYVENA